MDPDLDPVWQAYLTAKESFQAQEFGFELTMVNYIRAVRGGDPAAITAALNAFAATWAPYNDARKFKEQAWQTVLAAAGNPAMPPPPPPPPPPMP